jgi:regulator of sigma E protease
MAHPGINFKADWIKVPFHQAVIEASRQAWVFSTMIYGFLGGLFTEKVGMGDIMGPVGIISFTYKAASWGIVQFIIVLSMFSINLSIINLLPFPGLDGGRLVFLIAELIARKPLMKAKVENMIHFIGFCLLFALIILVTYFDFHRIFVQ